MKKNFTKKAFYLMSLLLIPATLNMSFNPSTLFNSGFKYNATDNGESNIDNDKQYIGLGYNVASGKNLHEGVALNAINPILNIEEIEAKNKIAIHEQKSNSYNTFTSKRADEVAKQYSKYLEHGGIKGNVSSVSVDLNSTFNKKVNPDWENVLSEEYSYSKFVAGEKSVYLQMTIDEIPNYLTDTFKSDINSVTTEEEAISLFNKYGTHLLTGYELGGVFEMTNYYATDSRTYQKEDNLPFSSQVENALASYKNGNDSFSFTEQYGVKNNNAHATNNYSCRTYGGATITDLTIDTVFSKIESESGNEYGYSSWLNSINNGENLTIVDIPKGNKMIPLWDLLPLTNDGKDLKKTLISAYVNLTSDAYTDYLKNNPNKYVNDVDNKIEIKTDFIYDDLGYTYSSISDELLHSNYVDINNEVVTNKINVRPNGFVYMNYDSSLYYGQDAKWEVSNPSVIEVIDSRNGVFKILNVPTGSSTIKFTVNGKVLLEKTITIANTDFTYGDGTYTSPYLISTAKEFMSFVASTKNGSKGKYYKLINDIDLGGADIEMIGGNDQDSSKAFEGEFDGNFHKISNFNVASKEKCLFFYNRGVIKNLDVDYSKTNMNINNGTSFVSGIAAYNDTNGSIINCSVSNFNVNYLNKNASGNVVGITNKIAGSENDLYVGGIASYNKGIIRGCRLNNSTIDVEAYERVDNLMVGGICAFGKKEIDSIGGYILDCQVDSSSFDVDLYKGNHNDAIRVGGIVGKISGDKFQIRNCLIKDMYRNSKGFSISAKNHSNFSTTLYRYEGGIVAYIEDTALIENCVILGDMNIQDIDSYGQYLGVGLVCGQESKNSNKAKIDNCFVESSITSAYVFSGQKSKEGVVVKDKLYKVDFGASFNNIPWNFDSNKKLELLFADVNYSSLELDLTNVKTEFSIGEKFTFNGLKIKGSYNDGTDYSDRSFYVDSSKFNSSEKGTYEISVHKDGKVYKYNVTVDESPLHSIYVKEKGNNVYFVGDKSINLENIEVHAVKNDGTDVILNQDHYYCSVPESGLELGRNNLTFSCGEKKCTFEVLAFDKTENSIVLKDPTILSKTYHAADEIDFSNVDFEVSYVDGTTKIVKGSECEILYSRIIEGLNEVTVRYNGTVSIKFEVKGSFFIEEGTVDEFINLVNKINPEGTLQEQFDSINLAKVQMDKIDDRYVGSTEYQEAKAKYNNYVKTFNDLIADINNGVEEGTKIADTFNVQVSTAAGYTLLALIIGLIIKNI